MDSRFRTLKPEERRPDENRVCLLRLCRLLELCRRPVRDVEKSDFGHRMRRRCAYGGKHRHAN